MERANLLGRLGEHLEELVVDLHALRLAVRAAAVVVVGHLKPRRPVLHALAVGQRGDLALGLVEPAERQHAAYLDREEPRLRLRPPGLRRGDHRLREIGVAKLDESLHIGDFGFKRLVDFRLFGGGPGLLRERREGRCGDGRATQNI